MTGDDRRAGKAEGWVGQRWAALVGYGLIVGLTLLVLRPFLVAIAWAAILAYATWPAFQRVRRLVRGRTTLAAAIMTLGVVLVVMVPAAVILLALANEVQGVYTWLRQNFAAVPAAALGWVQAIPRVGPGLADRIGASIANPADIQQWALSRVGGWAGTVGSLAAGIGRGVFEVVLVLMTLFVLYGRGQGLTAGIARAIERLGGPRMSAMLGPLGETVRAVTYGTLLTALAQGMLVMLACWAAGMGAPVLLGAVTGILSLTPVGAPLVYLPAGVWLLVDGRYLAGGLFLGWGFLVVSSVDNVIRSWFLSGAARIPFFLGLLGLLGGVAAFGALGLFIGPVVIGLMLTLWREWTDGSPPGGAL